MEIVFSKEFIDKNEEFYLENEKDIARLKKELSSAIKKRRCRVCGGRHYRAGYCITCYMKHLKGNPTDRKAINGVLSKRTRTLEGMYSRIMGTECKLESGLEAWADGLFELVGGAQADAARMYFIEGLSCRDLAVKIGVSHEIANRRVRAFIEAARKIAKGD